MIVALTSSGSFASEPMTEEVTSTTWPPVGPQANPSGVTNGEYLFNFGVVYTADWAFYIASQHDTILDNGSFHKWLTNWYQPHFDNDSFEYNIFKHSLVGMSYYQWFRSRGYTVQTAFLWTFASSLAFELFIETVTERPSIQDIYQTPVYGTVLGIGLEKLSQICHRTETALGHVCGYILDPFTLIPKSPKFVVLAPQISKEAVVANFAWEF